MPVDASEPLGALQLAGAEVNPIGAARTRARRPGAGVGIIPMAIAAKLMFAKKSKARCLATTWPRP